MTLDNIRQILEKAISGLCQHADQAVFSQPTQPGDNTHYIGASLQSDDYNYVRYDRSNRLFTALKALTSGLGERNNLQCQLLITRLGQTPFAARKLTRNRKPAKPAARPKAAAKPKTAANLKTAANPKTAAKAKGAASARQ